MQQCNASNMVNWLNIKLVVMDFDGVLTDNFVYVNELEEETVRCCKADSVAIDILKARGVQFVIITNDLARCAQFRARKMGVHFKQAVKNKSEYLTEFLHNFKVTKDQILFIGNDLNDLELMQSGVMSACPADSHPSVKTQAGYTLYTSGGHGVMREVLALMEGT